MLLTGFVAGILFTLVVIYLLVQKLMFLVNESRYGFDETNLLIEKQAAEMKWGVPFQYDLQATLKKHGYEVKPVRIFSLCKPEVANKILGDDKGKQGSALMPCRVSVYQRNNGKTYISRLNAAFFSRFQVRTIREAMKLASAENEQLLEPVLRRKNV